jgi:hypothetical protein
MTDDTKAPTTKELIDGSVRRAVFALEEARDAGRQAP